MSRDGTGQPEATNLEVFVYPRADSAALSGVGMEIHFDGLTNPS